MTTIPIGTATVDIDEWLTIRQGDQHSSGTLYHGDPEKIIDYLSAPDGTLEIQGMIHTILLWKEDAEFVLQVVNPFGSPAVRFGADLVPLFVKALKNANAW